MDVMSFYRKKRRTGWFARFLLCGLAACALSFAGCTTTDSATVETSPLRRSRQNTADPLTLKSAIDSIVTDIEEALKEKMQPGEKLPIAVLRIDSSWNELSDWISDELEAEFSNGSVLRLVDKKNTDIVRGELTEQNSGYVSEELVQRMGQETGAKYIVSGDLFEDPATSSFRLRIYLTAIESNIREMTPTRYVIKGDAQIQPYIEREEQQKELAAQRQQEEKERMRQAEEQRKIEEARQAKLREEARERELARVSWKRKWLYFGARGGFSYRHYQMSKDDFDPETTETEAGFPYEIAAHLALQFAPLLALQVEGIYTYDTVEYSGIGLEPGGGSSRNFKASLDSSSIMIPVLLKLQGRPDIFKFSLFAGGYYVYQRGNMKYEAGSSRAEYDYKVPFGFVAGIDAGFKMGPGVLFLDARFAMDVGKTSIQDLGGKSLALYDRMMGSFTVGYELGLFEKSDSRDYD